MYGDERNKLIFVGYFWIRKRLKIFCYFHMLARNMTEYYNGKLEDMDGTKICRKRGYGNTESNGYRKWQVLATQLTFVIVFEVCIYITSILQIHATQISQYF